MKPHRIMDLTREVVLAFVFAAVVGFITLTLPGATAPRFLVVAVTVGVLAFIGLVVWDRWQPSSAAAIDPAPPAASASERALPSLRLGPQLEMDDECFRLRVFNDSDVRCEPRVIVTAVTDDTGKDVLPPAQAPLELAWTHRPDGERASLAKSDVEGETVAVFWVRTPTVSFEGGSVFLAAKELLLYGMHYRPLLARLMYLDKHRTITAHLVVSCPEYPSMERIRMRRRANSRKEAAAGSPRDGALVQLQAS